MIARPLRLVGVSALIAAAFLTDRVLVNQAEGYGPCSIDFGSPCLSVEDDCGLPQPDPNGPDIDPPMVCYGAKSTSFTRYECGQADGGAAICWMDRGPELLCATYTDCVYDEDSDSCTSTGDVEREYAISPLLEGTCPTPPGGN